MLSGRSRLMIFKVYYTIYFFRLLPPTGHQSFLGEVLTYWENLNILKTAKVFINVK